jgi:hypothetical protein
MPSSRPVTIPTVIHLVRQLKPRSILDVGVGFGKWGHLFREYTDINEAERDPQRYHRDHWKIRIDGIEGNPAYLTEMHRFLYNEIYVGDARELIGTLPRYDVIFMGDVIEHLDKASGRRFLGDALQKTGKAVILTTPKYETGQGDLCANELERHRSLWTAREFRKFERATVKTLDRSMLLAVLLKPGVPEPDCNPPRQTRPADVLRLKQCADELTRLIPPEDPFILVDEEQMRGGLPHRRAIPFLERDGLYWGPPPDDAEAIREFERLRGAGARYFALTWPCFWWFDHYREFARHIRAGFKPVSKSDNLEVFDLRP